MKMISLLFCLLMLSACATPYQPLGMQGGYSQVQLNDDAYQVTFVGNQSTSQGRVHDLLLYRCAELTRQRGYEYFSIIDSAQRQHEEQDVTPMTISSTDSTGVDHGVKEKNKQIVVDPGHTNTYDSYEETATIKLLHEGTGKEHAVFKAQNILNSVAIS